MRGDDIDATLDDEATLPVEQACDGSPPAINGIFTPNSPLSAFDGETIAGTWVLDVSTPERPVKVMDFPIGNADLALSCRLQGGYGYNPAHREPGQA